VRVAQPHASARRIVAVFALVLFLVLGVVASWVLVVESRHPTPLPSAPSSSSTPLPVQREIAPLEHGIDTALTR
jgi:hypothetical protein